MKEEPRRQWGSRLQHAFTGNSSSRPRTTTSTLYDDNNNNHHNSSTSRLSVPPPLLPKQRRWSGEGCDADHLNTYSDSPRRHSIGSEGIQQISHVGSQRSLAQSQTAAAAPSSLLSHDEDDTEETEIDYGKIQGRRHVNRLRPWDPSNNNNNNTNTDKKKTIMPKNNSLSALFTHHRHADTPTTLTMTTTTTTTTTMYKPPAAMTTTNTNTTHSTNKQFFRTPSQQVLLEATTTNVAMTTATTTAIPSTTTGFTQMLRLEQEQLLESFQTRTMKQSIESSRKFKNSASTDYEVDSKTTTTARSTTKTRDPYHQHPRHYHWSRECAAAAGSSVMATQVWEQKAWATGSRTNMDPTASSDSSDNEHDDNDDNNPDKDVSTKPQQQRLVLPFAHENKSATSLASSSNPSGKSPMAGTRSTSSPDEPSWDDMANAQDAWNAYWQQKEEQHTTTDGSGGTTRGRGMITMGEYYQSIRRLQAQDGSSDHGSSANDTLPSLISVDPSNETETALYEFMSEFVTDMMKKYPYKLRLTDVFIWSRGVNMDPTPEQQLQQERQLLLKVNVTLNESKPEESVGEKDTAADSEKDDDRQWVEHEWNSSLQEGVGPNAAVSEGVDSSNPSLVESFHSIPGTSFDKDDDWLDFGTGPFGEVLSTKKVNILPLPPPKKTIRIVPLHVQPPLVESVTRTDDDDDDEISIDPMTLPNLRKKKKKKSSSKRETPTVERGVVQPPNDTEDDISIDPMTLPNLPRKVKKSSLPPQQHDRTPMITIQKPIGKLGKPRNDTQVTHDGDDSIDPLTLLPRVATTPKSNRKKQSKKSNEFTPPREVGGMDFSRWPQSDTDEPPNQQQHLARQIANPQDDNGTGIASEKTTRLPFQKARPLQGETQFSSGSIVYATATLSDDEGSTGLLIMSGDGESSTATPNNKATRKRVVRKVPFLRNRVWSHGPRRSVSKDDVRSHHTHNNYQMAQLLTTT